MHLCLTPSPGPRSIQSCSGGGMEAPLCLIPTRSRSVGQSIVPTNLKHPATPPLHPAAGKTVLGGPGHTTLLSTLTSK